jgi:hypothetical protein
MSGAARQRGGRQVTEETLKSTQDRRPAVFKDFTDVLAAWLAGCLAAWLPACEED